MTPDLTDASTRRAWRAYAAAALVSLSNGRNMSIPEVRDLAVEQAATLADLMVVEEQKRGTLNG